jgi:DNA-directed RNA polymerase specialized sigma24 family protein
MRLRGHDLEDALQLVALELIAFQYDAARSGGASQRTALIGLIDKRLAMMCRRETRHRHRIERLTRLAEYNDRDPATGHPLTPSAVEATDLAVDVREAVADLPPPARQVCLALAEGQSMSTIARQLGTTWRSVRCQMLVIRRHFARLGIGACPRVTTCREEAAA